MNKNNETYLHVAVYMHLLLYPSLALTSSSALSFRTPSADILPCHPSLTYISFRGTAEAHWCSRKVMAAVLRWELCLLVMFLAVKMGTQRSSLESPVTWIGLRQTPAL